MNYNPDIYKKPKFQKFLEINDFIGTSRENVQSFICPLCKGVLFRPIVDDCGHLFCSKCFEDSIAINNICPFDRETRIESKPKRILVISNFLSKQTLKCKNKIFGCEWEGNVRNFEYHYTNQCQFLLMNCPNRGCHLQMFRKELDLHLADCDFRMEKCEFCYIQMPLSQLNYHRDKICHKVPMICPLSCGEKVTKEKLKEHINYRCCNRKISCPFVSCGCKQMMVQKDLDKHLKEQGQRHMLFFYNSMREFPKELGESIGERFAYYIGKMEIVNKIEKYIDEQYEENNRNYTITNSNTGESERENNYSLESNSIK